MDIAGFIPGIGDAMDAINLGISIFRGNVLDSVFSAIAIIPGLGSAISTPLKAIFNAVGNSSSITKADNTLGMLFGSTSKISSKLSGISSGIRKLANKIPSAIASLKNNYVIKSLIGKKNLDNIVSAVRKGINSLVSRANEVISSVKKTVNKNIKEEVAAKTASLKYHLQFFASKETIYVASKINVTIIYKIIILKPFMTIVFELHERNGRYYEKKDSICYNLYVSSIIRNTRKGIRFIF